MSYAAISLPKYLPGTKGVVILCIHKPIQLISSQTLRNIAVIIDIETVDVAGQGEDESDLLTALTRGALGQDGEFDAAAPPLAV